MMETIAQNIGRYNFVTNSVDLGTQYLIISAFNEAQELIYALAEPSSLFTTTSVYLETGVYEYEFVDFDMDDCKHIYSIKLWDGTKYRLPMQYILPVVWDNTVAPYIETSTGKPEVFTWYNKVLYFSRKPDDDYLIEIRFNFEPAPILNSDSYCDIDDFEAGLIYLATALTWLKLEEVELYKEWKKMAGDIIKPVRTDNRTELTGRSSSYVKGRGSRFSYDYYNDPFIKGIR